MSRCGMISTTTIIIFLAYSQNCTQFMAAPGRSRLESPSWRRTASLLALLCSVLICLQSSAQQGPRVFVGAAEAAAADDGELLTRHQQQGGGKQLLSSGDLEPIVMDGLDPSDQKGVGEPETLIGSGSSFAAALHSDAVTAYSQHIYPMKLPGVKSHQDGNQDESKSIRMKYYSLGSSRGRCRFQNFDEECDTNDIDYPQKEDGPFAFAASDSPYTLEYHSKYPSHQVLPVAASAVAAVYNVPDKSSGKLELSIDLPTLARIFTGNITNWRHPDMLSLNPAVSDSLPDEDIHVVVRMGGSGTTAIFKAPLVKHHRLFEEQNKNNMLESGGPEGWPAGQGKFTYEPTNSDIGFAMLSKPYSIGYMVHYEAVNLGLSMFSIFEDCVHMRLDLEGVVDAVDAVRLPDDYHGLTDAEKATLKLDLEVSSLYRTARSFQWPFIGFTYIIIRQGGPDVNHEAGDNVPSCNQMKLMAEYMVWFYESDIVHEIAATHMFGTLAKPVRELLVSKLHEMTCEGDKLVDKSRLKVFDGDLKVEVALTTTKDIEQLMLSRFLIFRTQEPSFRAVTYVKNGGNPTQPLQINEDFRLISAHGKVDLAEAVSLPWIISALVVRANLPYGHESFLLDLETLRMIFRGEVTSWDDPTLVALNPKFEDPVFNGRRIILLSNLDVLRLMNGILDAGQNEGTEVQPLADMDINMIMAQLREQQFALAALPAYVNGGAFGALARLATESKPDGVEPGRDSVKACLAEVGLGLINRAYQGCYPLVFSVSALLHKKYADNANERGKLATLFWYDTLKNMPEVEERHSSIIHVYQSDRTSNELKVEMERTIFSIQYSDGTAILKKYRPSKVMTVVVASVSVVIFILILVLIVLGILYWRMRRRLARIAVMTTELQFDTESPAIKVMKFLQGISSGERLNKEHAQELLVLLRHTRNLQTPDITSQVWRMKQDVAMKDQMSGGIWNYLIQMLNEESWQISLSGSRAFRSNFSISKMVDRSVMDSINEILERAHDPLTSSEDLLKLVSTIGNAYFFNPMYLQAICGNRPLSTITMCLLHESGLIQGLHLDRAKLVRYMLAVEDNYPSNPYHNATHAAFVVHRTCVTLRKLEIGSSEWDMALMLSALIGAAVHDVLHPGVSNGYLVKVEAGVARDFNDQAVLENNSLRMALELLRQPDTSFLEGSLIKASTKQTFKNHLIKVVLGTDMSSHFDVISSFQQKVSFETEKIAWGDLAVEQKGLVIQMSVKAADIGHCTARMKQHLYWSKCLEDEFFIQGDTERKADLEISPMMDRDKPGVLWPKNQVGFFTVIVLPMLEAFAATFPTVEPLLLQARANMAYWKQVGHGFKAQPAEKYLADMMALFTSKGATLYDDISDLDCDPAPREPSLQRLPSLKIRPSQVCMDENDLDGLIGVV